MALEDDMALLSRVRVFAGMDRDALRLLAFSAEQRHLRAGATLFRKGEPSDGGFVVAKGAIALVDDDARAADAVVGPGTLIGEVALITPTRRPATAVAREPTTLLRISRAMFRRTLEEYPEVAASIAADLRQRVTSMSKDLSGVQTTLDPKEE